MRYPLFLLVTATLFIRPGEIVESTHGWPIYEYAIPACLAVSITPVLNQLSTRSLVQNPITACVVGLLFAVVLSHLAHFRTWEARMSGIAFLKIVIYYLLLVAAIDSEARLRGFLKWLLIFITVLAVLALLAAHGVITLPGEAFAIADKRYDVATGELIVIERLRSTGVFQDPNDLAMILVAGVAIALYFATDRAAGLLRFAGLPLVALFGYSIYRTQSRGGFLALMAALLTLFYARWGWKRTAMAAAVALPLLLVAFNGRMTSVDSALGEDTGQSRVQLWSAGLQLFKQQPLFGIGFGNYAEEAGNVAHNSFLHCFTELGFFGGSLFLGAVWCALVQLFRFTADEMLARSGRHQRMINCLLAITAGVAVSMLSLSRSYVVPTYLVLGLVAAFVRIAGSTPCGAPLPFDLRFVKRLAFASTLFLASIYVFVRVTARWS